MGKPDWDAAFYSAAPDSIYKLSQHFSSWTKLDTVILGDLNMDWLSPAADDFETMCLDLHLVQMITTPTVLI